MSHWLPALSEMFPECYLELRVWGFGHGCMGKSVLEQMNGLWQRLFTINFDGPPVGDIPVLRIHRIDCLDSTLLI